MTLDELLCCIDAEEELIIELYDEKCMTYAYWIKPRGHDKVPDCELKKKVNNIRTQGMCIHICVDDNL